MNYRIALLTTVTLASFALPSIAAARNRQSSTARANEGVHRTENK